MARAFSDLVANARLDSYEVTVGTAPQLRFYTGSPPATCATAATGTLLAQMSLPADWMANAAGRSKAILGAWTTTGLAAAGGGTVVGYFRIYDSTGTTCHDQGTVATNVASLATSALTAANSNVLNFAATTGVVVGLNVSGTGIPSGVTVLAVTGTTVTMSAASSIGVASAATIAFGADMSVDNANLAVGQNLTVTTFTLTA